MFEIRSSFRVGKSERLPSCSLIKKKAGKVGFTFPAVTRSPGSLKVKTDKIDKWHFSKEEFASQ